MARTHRFRVRAHPNAPPRLVDLEEFVRLASSGQVTGATEVRDHILTRDEWWPACDLRVFHANSPAIVPPGERLMRRLAQEREEEQSKLYRTTVLDAYASGRTVEGIFALPSLPDVLTIDSPVGVARLIVLPSFDPESAVDVRFQGDWIELHMWVADRSIWEWLSGMVPASVSGVSKSKLRIPTRECPPPFASWPEFLRAAGSVTQDLPIGVDGVSYLHTAQDQFHHSRSKWWSPDEGRGPEAQALIKAYAALIHASGAEVPAGWEYTR